MARRLSTLIVLTALVVAACGGDAERALTADEEALVAALVVEFESDPEAPFSADDGSVCFAEGLVRHLGLEKLAEIGVTPATVSDQPDFVSLTEDEMNGVADVAIGCVDYMGAFVDDAVADGLSRSSAECLGEGLDESGFFRATLISGLTLQDIPNEDQYMSAFIGAATRCLTPAELADFMGGE